LKDELFWRNKWMKFHWKNSVCLTLNWIDKFWRSISYWASGILIQNHFSSLVLAVALSDVAMSIIHIYYILEIFDNSQDSCNSLRRIFKNRLENMFFMRVWSLFLHFSLERNWYLHICTHASNFKTWIEYQRPLI